MRSAPLLSLVLLAACSQPAATHTGTAAPATAPTAAARPAASEATAPPPTGPAVRVDAAQAECVENWLNGHNLDAYGNPKGTVYAGGTPTFDEKTGATVDRWVLVSRNRPEALQLCHVPLGP